jgi:hypothetical protein
MANEGSRGSSEPPDDDDEYRGSRGSDEFYWGLLRKSFNV